jgi:hypothetical protein
MCTRKTRNSHNTKTMSQIIRATLLTLAIAPTFLFFCSVASADDNKPKRTTVCRPVQQVRVVEDAADHPGAYKDGYREGQESARKKEAYKLRSVGGEFARGFEDGYNGRSFTGQRYEVADRLETYSTSQCDTITIYDD